MRIAAIPLHPTSRFSTAGGFNGLWTYAGQSSSLDRTGYALQASADGDSSEADGTDNENYQNHPLTPVADFKLAPGKKNNFQRLCYKLKFWS